MRTTHAAPPLFVAIEPSGAAALEPARRIAWACEKHAGVASAPDLQEAAGRIAELARTHAVYLADPLFDEPRLSALFAAEGQALPGEMADWLMALAPYRQARRLAAIQATASERADPDNPAAVLYEMWLEAARLAGRPTP